MKTIRIATRNSPLALWQANYVKDRLLAAHEGLLVEIVPMTTKGDQLLDRSLVTAGGKGLFLKELEVSLLENKTDIAVHSMKDVPVDLPRGLEISVVCEREDPRDAMVSNNYQNLYALPKGARVGTSSLRRVAQLKAAFPALEFIELRGNVNTRLSKLDNGDYDAIILAAAGLIRLGLVDRIKQFIQPELCLPAVGQGIVGIECRSDDATTKALLEPLHSKQSAVFLAAERAMNASLEGGCQVPVAGYAQMEAGKIRLRGLVGKTDGSKILSSQSTTAQISISSAAELGQQVAEDLLKQGAGEILSSVYKEPLTLNTVSKPMVLLTRQHRYLGNTAAILHRLDYTPTHIPTLAIEAQQDVAMINHLEQLDTFTDIVFVSRNAVEFGFPLLTQFGGVPPKARVMAVGAETAKQLYRHGVNAHFPEKGQGAEALLAVDAMQKLKGRKVLIMRGEAGLDWPAEEMRKRGGQVLEAKCYEASIPAESSELLTQAIQKGQKIEGVFVHSQQSVNNLVTIAGDNLPHILQATLVAGTSSIAMRAKGLGWKGDILIAESPSNKHMMIAFSR